MEMTRVARLLFEAAGESGRRALGVRMRRNQSQGRREDRRCERRAHFAFCSAMRPTLLASVPNHIVRVLRSKNMLRIEPLTSIFAKNFSVFGSKPTRRLALPVSENQMRS